MCKCKFYFFAKELGKSSTVQAKHVSIDVPFVANAIPFRLYDRYRQDSVPANFPTLPAHTERNYTVAILFLFPRVSSTTTTIAEIALGATPEENREGIGGERRCRKCVRKKDDGATHVGKASPPILSVIHTSTPRWNIRVRARLIPISSGFRVFGISSSEVDCAWRRLVRSRYHLCVSQKRACSRTRV